LAARSGRDGWYQSQSQMRNVGFVLTRRSLGILRSQSILFGDTGRKWGKERSKQWRARQCETSTSTPVLVTRASETWPHETRIPGPVARVSGWSVRDTSRRARRLALVGLQLRQHELQRSTFVLLAQRRTSEGDKNGSVGRPGFRRFKLGDIHSEFLVDLHRSWWSGITPDNAPIFSRDISTDEIYALDLGLP
jgi:hypothetical protein